MVGNALRALWVEPRPADPPVRVWRDWALVTGLVAWSVAETLLREDQAWWPLVLTVSVIVALTLLWRRTHPLAAVAVAFGTLIAFDLARVLAIDATGLLSISGSLVLPYALFRWGSGREAAVGLGFVLVWLGVTHVADPTDPAEVVAGVGFFLFSAALGASIRFRASARVRDIEQAKLRQRGELARELHDTVGHHVSAIAIQAQAGRMLAATDPGRAAAVLETIEETASRALAEMRAMVGALREARSPTSPPNRGWPTSNGWHATATAGRVSRWACRVSSPRSRRRWGPPCTAWRRSRSRTRCATPGMQPWSPSTWPTRASRYG
jgi:hypothetical protein